MRLRDSYVRHRRLRRTTSPSFPIILDGLQRLEYRGYDSAGIAVVKDGEMDVRRSAGKLANLEQSHLRRPARRRRTASATRAGPPTAGPPRRTPTRTATARGRIVVVHNGIIENYLELKRELVAEGHTLRSPRPTPRSSRTWSQDEWQDDGLEHGRAARDDAHARAVRAGAAVGRRSRTSSSRSATARRSSSAWARASLRRLRRAGDPRATPATSCSWTIARWPWSRARACSSRSLDGTPSSAARTDAHDLGSGAWPRRAATSTSCSRRSSSSRARARHDPRPRLARHGADRSSTR